MIDTNSRPARSRTTMPLVDLAVDHAFTDGEAFEDPFDVEQARGIPPKAPRRGQQRVTAQTRRSSRSTAVAPILRVSAALTQWCGLGRRAHHRRDLATPTTQQASSRYRTAFSALARKARPGGSMGVPQPRRALGASDRRKIHPAGSAMRFGRSICSRPAGFTCGQRAFPDGPRRCSTSDCWRQ